MKPDDNFPICAFAQLNIEFPLKLTTTFPSVTQCWAIKSVSVRSSNSLHREFNLPENQSQFTLRIINQRFIMA